MSTQANKLPTIRLAVVSPLDDKPSRPTCPKSYAALFEEICSPIAGTVVCNFYSSSIFGLECTEHLYFDLIIVAKHMRHLSGYELLCTLRNVRDPTPVVLLIGENDTSVTEDLAKDLGFSGILRDSLVQKDVCSVICSALTAPVVKIPPTVYMLQGNGKDYTHPIMDMSMYKHPQVSSVSEIDNGKPPKGKKPVKRSAKRSAKCYDEDEDYRPTRKRNRSTSESEVELSRYAHMAQTPISNLLNSISNSPNIYYNPIDNILGNYGYDSYDGNEYGVCNNAYMSSVEGTHESAIAYVSSSSSGATSPEFCDFTCFEHAD